MTIIRSTRDEEGRILLLDCGGVFANKGENLELNADISIKAMKKMEYDAVAPGKKELFFGKDYLNSFGSLVPLVSTNLISEDDSLSNIKKYILTEIDGIRVAILGIFPLDELKKVEKYENRENLRIILPKNVLDEVLPVIRPQSDVVILLSQYGYEYTSDLLEKVPGIDVAICCKEKNKDTKANPRVLSSGIRGLGMGTAKVLLTKEGTKISSVYKLDLDESVPEDEEISKLINDSVKEKLKQIQEERKKKELEEIIELHKGLKKQLDQISPEEFYQKLLEEQRRQQEKKKPSLPANKEE